MKSKRCLLLHLFSSMLSQSEIFKKKKKVDQVHQVSHPIQDLPSRLTCTTTTRHQHSKRYQIDSLNLEYFALSRTINLASSALPYDDRLLRYSEKNVKCMNPTMTGTCVWYVKVNHLRSQILRTILGGTGSRGKKRGRGEGSLFD